MFQAYFSTCLPEWAIARPGLHFAHPGNVERPTQTRGYFCIMNHNRKNNENLILENSKYIVWLFIYLQDYNDQRQEVKKLQAVFECNNAVRHGNKGEYILQIKWKWETPWNSPTAALNRFAKDLTLPRWHNSILQRFTRVTKNISKTSPLGQVVYSSIVGCAFPWL